MFPEGDIVRLHVWLGGLLPVGVCVGGVRCVGHGHGGSVGIRTLIGGVVICILGGVGAVGTLGSGGAVYTLGRGGAGRPICWVVGSFMGSAKCIILSS